MLSLPRISIGRAGLVHHMFPTAIRFWEKEGLGPRGGNKDVVAFALFEEDDDKLALVRAWMERIGRVYSVRIIVLEKHPTTHRFTGTRFRYSHCWKRRGV